MKTGRRKSCGGGLLLQNNDSPLVFKGENRSETAGILSKVDPCPNGIVRSGIFYVTKICATPDSKENGLVKKRTKRFGLSANRSILCSRLLFLYDRNPPVHIGKTTGKYL